MNSLKMLNLAALPKADANPTIERRNRTITRLEEQKLLLTNLNYVRRVQSR